MREAPSASAEHGVVTLEAALGVGLVVAAAVLLVHVLAFGRDVLLVHEAARAGARAAATSTGHAAVVRAAREAAPDLPITVSVVPAARQAGDLARVEVALTTTVGPLRPRVRARAAARVEPAVGPGMPRHGPDSGPWSPP